MLLCAGFFAYWLVLGFALVTALQSRPNVLQALLLAPVTGMSALLLPVFLLNRFGLPIGQFALPLGIFLLAGAAALWWRMRPPMPWRLYLPFVLVFCAALAVTGWPILLYGFDWVSYANSDMAAISFAAEYFLHHGFADGPDARALARGIDYSQYAWFLYVAAMHRVGNEMLLSWAAGVSHLRPDQVYMSLTLALHVMLLSATAALVLQGRRLRLAALVAAGLLAASALSTQAVLNQLSSQVGGLALLAGAATALMRPRRGRGWRREARAAALIAILVAAMLLYYPEMLPILGLSFILWSVAGAMKSRMPIRMTWIVAAAGGILSLAVIGKQAIGAFVHLLGASSAGAAAQGILEHGFPYFLKPNGLAILWGLQTFNLPAEPWASITIALGALLLVGAVLACAYLVAYHFTPAAAIASVILGLSFALFFRRSDFGLFKAAFFAQPFLLATLAVAWLTVARGRMLQIAAIGALGLGGCAAHNFYTLKSADMAGPSVEIWKGSSLGVKGEFEGVLAAIPPDRVLALDTPNFVLAELQALVARGRPSYFTFDMGDALAYKPAEYVLEIQRVLNPDIAAKYARARLAVEEESRERYPHAGFQLHASGDTPTVNTFSAPRLPADRDAVFVSTTSVQSLFNRTLVPQASGASFLVRPLTAVSDHLAFVPSDLGPNYMSFKRIASFYQVEADPYFPHRTMAGVGRHLLFRVINPSQGSRLLVEVTASLRGDRENRLPAASVVGSDRVPLHLLGRGCARVFAPALAPQWIEGSPYLAIDMNSDAVRFPSRETGLMNLYGRDQPLDRRRVVGFARNISLVSAQDLARLRPPSEVSTFPAALADPALEFSGLYEDGWMSEEAFLILRPNDGSRTLRIAGVIPAIDDAHFSTELSVRVDGKPVAAQRLGVGEFTVAVPVPAMQGNHRVDVKFSRFQRLPGDDGRPVTALLKSVGFATEGKT